MRSGRSRSAAVGAIALAIRRPRSWRELLGFSAVSAFADLGAAPVVFLFRPALPRVLGRTRHGDRRGWNREPGAAEVARSTSCLESRCCSPRFFVLPPLGDAMPWFLTDGKPPRRATADLIHQQTTGRQRRDQRPRARLSRRVRSPRLASHLPRHLARRRVRVEKCSCASASIANSPRRAIRSTTLRPVCSRTAANGRSRTRADHMHDQIEAWVRGRAARCSSPTSTRRIRPRSRACSAATLRFEQTGTPLDADRRAEVKGRS